jgi:hypothetical protein
MSKAGRQTSSSREVQGISHPERRRASKLRSNFKHKHTKSLHLIIISLPASRGHSPDPHGQGAPRGVFRDLRWPLPPFPALPSPFASSSPSPSLSPLTCTSPDPISCRYNDRGRDAARKAPAKEDRKPGTSLRGVYRPQQARDQELCDDAPPCLVEREGRAPRHPRPPPTASPCPHPPFPVAVAKRNLPHEHSDNHHQSPIYLIMPYPSLGFVLPVHRYPCRREGCNMGVVHLLRSMLIQKFHLLASWPRPHAPAPRR